MRVLVTGSAGHLGEALVRTLKSLEQEVVGLDLGWEPRYDFNYIIGRLRVGDDLRRRLAQVIGSKGYHAEAFSDGPYPVE
jgi:nucleoside-diphosphate-sugar epimerase